MVKHLCYTLAIILIFSIIAINVRSSPDYEKVGIEASEPTLTPGDLDVTELEVTHDDTYLYFKVWVRENISKPSSGSKIWTIFLDTDCDSRNYESIVAFYDDYYINIELSYDGTKTITVYNTHTGGRTSGTHIDGGEGYKFWEIKVSRSFINPGDVFFIKLETKGADVVDNTPYQSPGSGDYWMYYLNPPTWSWSSTISDNPDDVKDGTPDYLEIHFLREGYDSNNLYFELEVEGSIPWNGGSSIGNYSIYIDADEDSSTGYLVSPCGIGADYQIRLYVGYVVKLYYWDGGWKFLKKEYWPHAPSLGTKLTIITPKSDYSKVPLGGSIKIVGKTYEDNNFKDEVADDDCSPVPVPELGVVSLIILLIAALRVLIMKK